MTHRNHNHLLIALVVVLLLGGVGYMLFAPSKSPVVLEPSRPVPAAGPISVRGEMTCLPHRDTSGPQTLECAFGLKDEQGRHYGLRDTDPAYGNIGHIPGGTTVVVTGEFTPGEDEKYASIGVIAVTGVTSAEIAGKTYENGTFGISFAYPEGYVLNEAARADGHHGIVLLRMQDSEIPVNGEGPPSISVDIRPSNEQTLSGWIRNAPESNFALSPDGTTSPTTVGGTEALSYRWSGLYEGETTAFLHEGNVIAVSVAWLAPEDPQVGAYRALLASFTLN